MPASPMAPLRSTTTRRVTRAAASSQNSRKRRSNAGPDPLFSGDEDKDDDDTVGTNAATAVTTANSTTPAPGSPSWGAWTAVKVAVGIVAALAVTRRAVFPLATAQEWATRHAHNVAGKTFVVTGGSSGVGFETAKALAAAGGNVVLTSRDLKRGALAVDTIKRSAFGPISQTGGQVRFLQLDQASIASVTEFADRLVQTTGAIHGLVLNAGQISQQFQCSEDGIERTFQVNHLANQILVNRTADALVRGSARVVVVTSFQGARYFRQSAAAASAPHTTAAAFGMFESYGNSKLANVRFARELSRRLGHGNVTAVSVHPGMISTNLGVSRGVGVLDWLDRVGARLFWLAMSPLTKSAQEGAATQTLCVVAPLAEVEAGGFYKDNRLSDAFPTTFQSNKQDEALDHETWEITEGLIRGDPTYRCGGGDQSAASAEPTSDRQRARADRDSDDNSARNMVLLVLLHPVLYLALFSTAEAVFGRSAGRPHRWHRCRGSVRGSPGARARQDQYDVPEACSGCAGATPNAPQLADRRRVRCAALAPRARRARRANAGVGPGVRPRHPALDRRALYAHPPATTHAAPLPHRALGPPPVPEPRTLVVAQLPPDRGRGLLLGLPHLPRSPPAIVGPHWHEGWDGRRTLARASWLRPGPCGDRREAPLHPPHVGQLQLRRCTHRPLG